MLVIVWVSDEVEKAVASWVDSLLHVTKRSFRLEEQERGTFDFSTGDVDPLGLSVGGTLKKTGHCTLLNCCICYYQIRTLVCSVKIIVRFSPSAEIRNELPEQAKVPEPLPIVDF